MEMSTLLLSAQRDLQVMSMDCGATETCLASPGCTHKYLATRWQSFPGGVRYDQYICVCLFVCLLYKMIQIEIRICNPNPECMKGFFTIGKW